MLVVRGLGGGLSAPLLLPVLLLGAVVAAGGDPRDSDWRNIANGQPLIDRVGYYDQPAIVVEPDGSWVCVMTEGDTKEGEGNERVIALRSMDKGKTWPVHGDIEPRNQYGPPSAWVVPVQAPRTNRLYAIYTYNERNITTLPNSSHHIRNDIIGVQAFRYSTDGGKTWSARHTIPIEEKQIDKGNEYKGEVRLGWTVGKPIITKQGTVMIQYTKRGSITMDNSLGYIKMQNFVLASDNLLEEEDPGKIRWKTFPGAEEGLTASAGDLSEEGDLVEMSSGTLYFAYRTFDGYINVATSEDGGQTFSRPGYAVYGHQPGGTELAFLKNPNGPITPRRMASGNYLILFYNNGDNSYWLHRNSSLAHTWRNPYWISGGVEVEHSGRRTIHWSQPEIAFYTTKNTGHGIGYPDIFQDADGEYYVAETNKETGRLHSMPKTFVENLWNQDKLALTSRGLFKKYTTQAKANFFDAPNFPEIPDHTSMTLEFWVEHINGSVPDGTPLSCTESCDRCNEDLKSIAVSTNSSGVWIRMDTTYFHSDPVSYGAAAATAKYSHFVIVLDGTADVLVFVNNGLVSDGRHLRTYGWHFLSPELLVPPVTSCILDYDAHIVMKYYSVALTTSEIMGNFNAGPDA